MKKLIIGISIIQFILTMVLLFIIVSLSACNFKGNVSMDGKGRAIDNVFIERLWRTVKYENVYLQAYSDGAKLYKGLENYFEFYNTERFHQSINYKTPASLYYLDYVA